MKRQLSTMILQGVGDQQVTQLDNCVQSEIYYTLRFKTMPPIISWTSRSKIIFGTWNPEKI